MSCGLTENNKKNKNPLFVAAQDAGFLRDQQVASDVERFNKKIVEAKYIESLMVGRVSVGISEITNYYETNKNQFKRLDDEALVLMFEQLDKSGAIEIKNVLDRNNFGSERVSGVLQKNEHRRVFLKKSSLKTGVSERVFNTKNKSFVSLIKYESHMSSYPPHTEALACILTKGDVSGEILVCSEGLSFWGGVDPDTGAIIDIHHPCYQRIISGKILMMPSSRGSCSGSGVLLALSLKNIAPAAIVFCEAEEILSLGALVSEYIFKKPIPVARLTKKQYSALANAKSASIQDCKIFTDSESYELNLVKPTG